MTGPELWEQCSSPDNQQAVLKTILSAAQRPPYHYLSKCNFYPNQTDVWGKNDRWNSCKVWRRPWRWLDQVLLRDLQCTQAEWQRQHSNIQLCRGNGSPHQTLFVSVLWSNRWVADFILGVSTLWLFRMLIKWYMFQPTMGKINWYIWAKNEFFSNFNELFPCNTISKTIVPYFIC